jgi:hypothetical protein
MRQTKVRPKNIRRGEGARDEDVRGEGVRDEGEKDEYSECWQRLRLDNSSFSSTFFLLLC